ncbi:transcription factor MYBS3-like [Bidens hawaiensis]|uniref:transcription factor MYBS3-like n=1 Tax=Bidens hawaiensis TaxID=980011 RepID=UPI00404B60D5
MSDESSMKKCGYCGQTGHASTACNNGKVGILNLFGVRMDPAADKSDDDVDLQVVNGVSSSNHEPESMQVLKIYNNEHSGTDLVYVSDEHNQVNNKGVPWTKDEHRSFLTGLQKLGKGKWQAISKNYVPSRKPTQVASHAQKFFLRMNSMENKRVYKKRRRSSLFDMPLDECSTSQGTSVRSPVAPVAQIYGIEENQMGYHNHHIASTNYMFAERVYPLDRRMEHFATLVPQPLLITNGERCTTQEPEVERTKE